MNISRIAAFAAVIVALSSFAVPSGVPQAAKNKVYTAELKSSSEPIVASEEDFIYSDTGDGIELIEYTGKDKQVIIPETVEDKPVTSIQPITFTDTDIEYIRIPKTVNDISPLFADICDYLTFIDVDPENEFYCSVDGVLCSKDKTLLHTFPAGISGSYTIPREVTEIGSYAFDHCYSLTDINMYNNVVTICNNAFSFCWNLKKIRFSDSLKAVGSRAFYNCESLAEFHLPASLSSIASDAFLFSIESDGDMTYSFVDGIYCVPGTYSDTYLKTLHLPEEIINYEYKTLTDIDTGVVVNDINSVIADGVLLNVEALSEEDAVLSCKHDGCRVYNVSFTKNGKAYTPKKEFMLSFNDYPKTVPLNAVKVYFCEGSSAFDLYRSPSAPIVCAKSDECGKFAVTWSSDFTLKGDCDGNGSVTTYDTRIALMAATGLIDLSAPQTDCCDFDSDGIVTTDDARCILAVSAGIM